MPVAAPRTRPPLPVDDATRRQFLTGLAAAGLLTACSGPPTPAAPATRAFVDSTGVTVQIPDRPRRIYALRDNEAAGPLLALGAPVVGFWGETDPIRRSGLDPGPAVAHTGDLDVEAIAALRPDLIVTLTGDLDAADEDLLTAIAPLVRLDDTRISVDETTAVYAKLLGPAVTVDPATLRADLDQALAGLRDAAGVPWDRVTVAHVQPRADTFSAYAPTPTVVNDLLTGLGVRWNALNLRAAEQGGFLLDQSLETIDALAADLLVYDVLNDVDLDANPLFAALPQVRAGQVLRFEENVYGKHLVNYATVARRLIDMVAAMAPLRTGLAP